MHFLPKGFMKNHLEKYVDKSRFPCYNRQALKKRDTFRAVQNRLNSGKRRGSGVKTLSRKDRSQREQDDGF